MTERVVIIGAGGHAQVIADCLLRMAEAGSQCQPIGYVDDNPIFHGRRFLDLPVLGSIATLPAIAHDSLLVGIGNNRTRQQLYISLCRQGYCIATAIHPRAIVAPDVTIGAGSLISAGAVINTGTTIGRNVIINTAASVDHGSQIDDHAHVAPGVHLGGDVQIGKGALVGIGAIVMPQQTVGNWAIVGAATLVKNKVPDEATVVGIPGRMKKPVMAKR